MLTTECIEVPLSLEEKKYKATIGTYLAIPTARRSDHAAYTCRGIILCEQKTFGKGSNGFLNRRTTEDGIGNYGSGHMCRASRIIIYFRARVI